MRKPTHKFLHAQTMRVHRILRRKLTDMPSDLMGACAIGATALCALLKSLGHDAALVEGDNGLSGHCWVEVDGWICDPTASQFKISTRRFVTRRHRNKPYSWPKETVNPTFTDWPDEQSPLIAGQKCGVVSPNDLQILGLDMPAWHAVG